MGAAHPESPARLKGILKILGPQYGGKIIAARPVTDAQIFAAHKQEYWQHVLNMAPKGNERVQLDEDTLLSNGSITALRYGAGAGCTAIDMMIAGQGTKFFCAIRPPGHHAFSDHSMGFCILNNVAICASYALTQKDIKKVAIIDIDVHHGNGTQEIVQNMIGERCFFASIQQEKIWPYNDKDQIQSGNIYNIGMPERADSKLWMQGFYTLVDKIKEFAPDILIVSAGFDAHKDDPPGEKLFNDAPGRQMLLDEDFTHVAKTLSTLADEVCGGRMISCLEGGYSLDVLAKASAAYIIGTDQ